ncbi:hypothetical protein ABMA27_004162 [Loxostege sticticalis]|uniref:PHD-type domain-containing protein n=1 Tax=Loxostege sticticalis TaxID=481309 RepID=A0ABR3HMM4_LOXSC
MSSCTACKEPCNKEILRCRLCTGKFHYQCLNIDRAQYFAITKEQASSWICPSCNNITRRTRSNENTPVRRDHFPPQSEDSLNMSCDQPEPCTSHYLSPPSVLQMSSANAAAITNEVTMDKISALFDEKLSASLSVFMDSFRKVLKDDVREMVKSELGAALKVVTDDLSATTDFICAEQTLNARMTGIDRISRNCNIELQAIPERKNENLLIILKKLCEVVKAPVEDGHISACRRVAKLNNASNRPRNIVVTFSTPRIRDLVLSAAHRYNKSHPGQGLRSSDLDIPGEPRRFFVTEHLSPEQKYLHSATRKAAKECSFKYVWVKYGQIYVRKDDSSGAIIIHNLDSLQKLR